MNPFNQKRYRNEHEIGEAYITVREVYENLASIKAVAENLQQLRSGNIELKTDGLELLWKYAAEDEWRVLGDLTPYISQYIQSVNAISLRMDAAEITIGTLLNSVQDLTGEVETFDGRLNTLNNTLEGVITDLGTLTSTLGDLSDDLNTLTNTVASHTQAVNANTQSISDLALRVTALEDAEEPEDPDVEP